MVWNEQIGWSCEMRMVVCCEHTVVNGQSIWITVALPGLRAPADWASRLRPLASGSFAKRPGTMGHVRVAKEPRGMFCGRHEEYSEDMYNCTSVLQKT